MIAKNTSLGQLGLRVSLAFGLCLFALSGSVAFAVSDATIVPGKTDTQIRVLPSGAVDYTVPIAVSAGTNGFAPNIHIKYNSSAGNGLLGRGWSLSGLGSITRCASTVATEGVTRGVNFTADDRFCLNGQKLVAVNGDYGAADSEYRTEVNVNRKILAVGSQSGAPRSFVVKAPDGKQFFYGETEDSRLELQGSQVISWALNRIVDLNGNYIAIEYAKDAARGTHLPQQILYTGNTAQNLTPYNRIEFYYTNRPDPQFACINGSLQQTDQRLSEVKVIKTVDPEEEIEVGDGNGGDAPEQQTIDRVSGEVVFRRYLLSYEDEGLLPAKSLASTACSNDAVDTQSADGTSAYQQLLDARYQDDVQYQQSIDYYTHEQAAVQARLTAVSAQYEDLLQARKEETQAELDALNDLYVSAVDTLDALTDEEIEQQIADLTAQRDAFAAQWDAGLPQLETDHAADVNAAEQALAQLETDREQALAIALSALQQRVRRAKQIMLLHPESSEKLSLYYEFRSVLNVKASAVYDQAIAASENYQQLVDDAGVELEGAEEALRQFSRYSQGALEFKQLYKQVVELEPMIEKSVDNHGFHLLAAAQIAKHYQAFADALYRHIEQSWDDDVLAQQERIQQIHDDHAQVLADAGQTLDQYQFQMDQLDSDNIDQAYDIKREQLQAYLTELETRYGANGLQLQTVQDTTNEVVDALGNIVIIAGYDRQLSNQSYQDQLDDLLAGDSQLIISRATAAATSLVAESRLASIMECGNDDSCMTPLQFTWQAESVQWLASNEQMPDHLLAYQQLKASGAGLFINPASFLFVNGGTIGGGTDGVSDQVTEELATLGRQLAKAGQLVDVNNDGLDDWVLAHREERGYEYRATWLNTGSGWEYSTDYTLPAIVNNHKQTPFGYFLDINNDGFVDWLGAVRLENGDFVQRTMINTQTGWEESVAWRFPQALFEESEEGYAELGVWLRNEIDAYPRWISSLVSGFGANLGNEVTRVDTGWLAADKELPFTTVEFDEFGVGTLTGQLVDVNNDGQLDWMALEADDTGVQYKAWTEQADEWTELTDYALTLGTDKNRGQFTDLNLDGYPEWLRAVQATDGTVTSVVMMNTGTGWLQDDTMQLPAIHNHKEQPLAYMLDFNGDGIADWLQALQTESGIELVATLLSGASGWQLSSSASLPYQIAIEDADNLVEELGVFNRLTDDASLDWLNQYDIWNAELVAPALVYEADTWVDNDDYRLPVLQAQWLNNLDQLITAIEQGTLVLGGDSNNLIVGDSGSTSSSGDGSTSGGDTTTLVNPLETSQAALMTGELVDLDGDGRLDWIKAIRFNDAVEQRIAWLRDDNGWVEHDGFRPPAILNDFTEASASRLVDVNADGLPDWLESYTDANGDVQRVWRNTGSGWLRDDSLALPRTLANRAVDGTLTTTAVLSDINGDGLLDILADPEHTDAEDSSKTWLNGIAQWQLSDSFVLPAAMTRVVDSRRQLGGQLQDINADGLPDWLAYTATGVEVWLNDGSQWIQNAAMALPVGILNAEGHQQASLLDLNSDGLPDLALSYQAADGQELRNSWINTGSGWRQSDVYLLPGQLFKADKGQVASTADINGDGRVDFVQSYDDGTFVHQSVWLNHGSGWIKRDDINVPVLLVSLDADGMLLHEHMFLDVDGDHEADLVSSYATPDSSSNSVRLAQPNGVAAIDEFFDGALRSKIEYGKGYKPYVVYQDKARQSYPLRSTTGPSTVVAGYQSFDPDDTPLADVTYSYGNFTVDLTGRGSLGFGWSESLDWFSGLVSLSRFRQDFPYIGQLSRIDTDQLWGNKIRTAHYSYDIAAEMALGLVKTPYTKTTIVQNYKSSGELLNTITEEVTANTWGQPQTTVETVAEGGSNYVTQMQLVHQHDTTNWVLGNAVQQTITKTSPDGQQSHTTSQTFVNNRLRSKTSAGMTETYTYNSFGGLIAISRQGANDAARTETQTFDGKGRFALSTRDVLGQEIEYGYHDIDDQPSFIIAQDGTRVDYVYDAFGRKIKELRPNNIVHAWAYRFCQGNATCPANAAYLMAAVDNEGESPETVYYDGIGREVRRATANASGRIIHLDTEYNELGKPSRKSVPYFRDEQPRWAEFYYDELGRTVAVKQASGGTKYWRYDGRSTTEYDELGNPKTTVETYFGAPASITDALGGITQYRYDPFGQLVATVDAAGNQSLIDYDTRGNKTRVDDPDHGITTFTYNDFDQVVSKTDALGNVESYTYDAFGRVLTRTDLDGQDASADPLVTTWDYTTGSANPTLVSSITASDGYAQQFIYDDKYRQTKTTVVLPNGETRAMETDYYGDSDLVATVKYPNHFSVRNIYDELGYLTEVRNAGLNTFEQYKAMFDRGKHYVEVIADGLHSKARTLKTVQLDPKIAVYETRYNEAIELYQDAEDISNDVEALQAQAAQHGNAMQQAHQHVLWLREDTNRFYNEPLHQSLMASFRVCRDTVLSGPQIGGPDDDLHLEVVRRQCGALDEWLYHKQVASLRVIDSYFAQMESSRSHMEAKIAAANAKARQLESVVNQANAKMQQAENYYNNTVKPVLNQYNALIETGNDFIEQAEQIFKEADHVYAFYEIESEISFWKAETFDATNRMLTEVFGNGIATTRTYDDFTGRLTGIVTENEAEEFTYQAEQYYHDAAGNLVARSDGVQGTLDTFQYDALHRLTSADYAFLDSGKTVNQQFSYDAIGNITHKSDIGSYQYNSDRPHAVVQAGDRSYQYDNAGRMTLGNDVAIEYTRFGKPFRLSNSDGEQVDFQYGADRSRYYQRRQTADSVVETYYFFKGLYDEIIEEGDTEQKNYINAGPDNVALLTGYQTVFDAVSDTQEFEQLPAVVQAVIQNAEQILQNGPGDLIEYESMFVLPEGIRARIWQVERDEEGNISEQDQNQIQTVLATGLVDIEYYHKDSLGSVKVVTDGNGELLGLNHYDAFGKPIYEPVDPEEGEPTTSDAPDSFTGHESIGNLDLVHMNGRVYDPEIARFVSADPMVPDFVNPQSFNRYAYVYNNPLKYVDVDGYQPQRHLSDLYIDQYIYLRFTEFFARVKLDPEKELYPLMRLTRSNPELVNARLASLGISRANWQQAYDYAAAAEGTYYAISQIKRAKRKAKYVSYASFIITAATGGLGAEYFWVAPTASAASTYAITGQFDLGDFALSLAVSYISASTQTPEVDDFAGPQEYIYRTNLQRFVANREGYQLFFNAVASGISSHLGGGEFEHGFGAALAQGVLGKHVFGRKGIIPIDNNILRNAIVQGVVAEIRNDTRDGERLDFWDGFQLGAIQGLVQLGVSSQDSIRAQLLGPYDTSFYAWGTVLNLIIEGASINELLGAASVAVSASIQQERSFQAWLAEQPEALQQRVALETFLREQSDTFTINGDESLFLDNEVSNAFEQVQPAIDNFFNEVGSLDQATDSDIANFINTLNTQLSTQGLELVRDGVGFTIRKNINFSSFIAPDGTIITLDNLNQLFSTLTINEALINGSLMASNSWVGTGRVDQNGTPVEWVNEENPRLSMLVKESAIGLIIVVKVDGEEAATLTQGWVQTDTGFNVQGVGHNVGGISQHSYVNVRINQDILTDPDIMNSLFPGAASIGGVGLYQFVQEANPGALETEYIDLRVLNVDQGILDLYAALPDADINMNDVLVAGATVATVFVGPELLAISIGSRVLNTTGPRIAAFTQGLFVGGTILKQRNSIALGLKHTLRNTANLTGGSAYFRWVDEGLSVLDPRVQSQFVDAFRQATSNAKTIYFNLDGLNLKRAVSMGGKGPFGAPNNVTNWEFLQVLSNPKTVFIQNNKPVPLQTILNRID